MESSEHNGRHAPEAAPGRRWRLLVLSAITSLAAAGAPISIALLMGWAGWPPLLARNWAFIVGIAMVAGLETFASGGTAASVASGGRRTALAATVLAGMTGFTLFAMATLSLKAPDRLPAAPMVLAGITLIAMGGWLRFCAVGRLGSRFTSDNSISEDALLEQGGVYRWLAHPSEVGLLLLSGGGFCLVQSGWFAGLTLLLFVLQTWRNHLEESALFSHYKDEYLEYRRRTLDPLPSTLLIVGGRK